MSLAKRVPDAFDPDAVYAAFEEWALESEITLYPAQAEALIGVVSGSNVILSTPTGSGKSLVATGAHFAALAQGIRTWYTAPVKALVSEKFFALVDVFGAENVGMMTGDSAVNPDAPIVCATAEILANLALRTGPDALVGQVVMDEFHYYADPERGWAWQVPLLTLPGAQFLLMSATLGDVTGIADDLSRRTGRETALVTGVDRPVPLHYYYESTPVHETVAELLDTDRAPVYIVHFSQAAALERAQALASVKVASRAQRDEIARELGDFPFRTGFGKTLSRLVRAGIGVHHAGMLPKYRRLVEQLAQRGLLRVVCGTDTLGVGINVPIRTVLLTALTKYDGTRMRRLTAREFHQISGRAGRPGYDTAGTVVAQAPEYEIENLQAVRKAGDDPKKLRKIVRKQPPKGFVSWGQPTFDRLVAAQPEPLTPRMQMTSAMLINVIGRGVDSTGRGPFENMRNLIFGNHEPRKRQLALARRALGIYRTLRTAGIVEQTDAGHVRLTVDLQPDFALNQPLSPFALAAFELLSPDDPGYTLDLISIVEATLDDPRPVLAAQQNDARSEAIAAMKADGIDYDTRMELLEQITWPKPLEELLTAAFETFSRSQPWIADFPLRPKSVVRDMYERALSFGEFIALYRLQRSEGVVLRYLSDAFRAARQTIPDDAKTSETVDLIEWLGELVRQVDSSLLDEWEELRHPDAAHRETVHDVAAVPADVTTNRRAFTVLVRNEMFRRVQLAARRRYDDLGELDAASGLSEQWTAETWADAMASYYAEHDDLQTGPDARSPRMLLIREKPQEGIWSLRQIFDDPDGDHDWGIDAEVDLAESAQAGTAIVRVRAVDRL